MNINGEVWMWHGAETSNFYHMSIIRLCVHNVLTVQFPHTQTLSAKMAIVHHMAKNFTDKNNFINPGGNRHGPQLTQKQKVFLTLDLHHYLDTNIWKSSQVTWLAYLQSRTWRVLYQQYDSGAALYKCVAFSLCRILGCSKDCGWSSTLSQCITATAGEALLTNIMQQVLHQAHTCHLRLCCETN